MFKLWQAITREFPGWDVVHTGGGIFVIRKNFEDRNGRPVMVSVSEDTTLIMRHHERGGKFISLEEFHENEDIYWEKAYDLEVVFLIYNDSGITLHNPGVFDDTVLEEIMIAVFKLRRIIWR